QQAGRVCRRRATDPQSRLGRGRHRGRFSRRVSVGPHHPIRSPATRSGGGGIGARLHRRAAADRTGRHRTLSSALHDRARRRRLCRTSFAMSGRMRERTGRYRIVVNAIHARAGGGVTYLRNLLPLLAAEPDLELHFIPPRGWKDAFGALSPTIHVHDVAMPGRWVSVLLWEQLVLPFIVWRIGFDAVFSPANFAPLALPAQVIVIQNAVTVGRHENRTGKRVYWFTLRMMTTLSLLTVRRAIAVSQYVADTAMPPLRHASLSVIHHGVGAAFSPAPVAQPPGDYLLAVSDLYIQKNLDRLIEAFWVVRRRYPAMA